MTCPYCQESLGLKTFYKDDWIRGDGCMVPGIGIKPFYYCRHGLVENSLGKLLNKCKECLIHHISESL